MTASTYNTKQKRLVMDIFLKNKLSRLSCEDVTYMLVANGTPVGKTTVYRQLEKLINEGKIKKLNPHNGKSFLYQFVDADMNCESHMHLRCIKCGEYVHLGCEFMSRVSQHILEHHNFAVDNSKTEILGLCDNCRKGE